MSVYILYPKYYDFDNRRLHIGGVETYITNLTEVLKEMNLPAIIVQAGSSCRLRLNECVEIHSLDRNQNDNRSMLSYAEKHGDVDNDILLFMDSEGVLPTRFKKVIAIQHGIGFDRPWVAGRQIPDLMAAWFQFLRARVRIHKQKYVSKLVCVDYNYINWLRTQTIDRRLNYTVIPNFSDIPPKKRENVPEEKIQIVFARRLEVVRGARLMIGIFRFLLAKYDNIALTIAGDGKCLNELKAAFAGQSRVAFTSYSSQESVAFHQQFDIAVVPSIASEGTSLSLLEAMAAGCAVLATDIGGMTNIVLDGYNGLLCRPDEKDCIEKLSMLIESAELRKRLSENACETVAVAFSLERWKASWKNVFEEFLIM